MISRRPKILKKAPATGEKAFTKIKGSSVYATNPMLPRLSESIHSLPQNTHFIFGADSWLSSEPAEILQQKATEKTDKNVTVHKVEGIKFLSIKKIMLF